MQRVCSRSTMRRPTSMPRAMGGSRSGRPTTTHQRGNGARGKSSVMMGICRWSFLMIFRPNLTSYGRSCWLCIWRKTIRQIRTVLCRVCSALRAVVGHGQPPNRGHWRGDLRLLPGSASSISDVRSSGIPAEQVASRQSSHHGSKHQRQTGRLHSGPR